MSNGYCRRLKLHEILISISEEDMIIPDVPLYKVSKINKNAH